MTDEASLTISVPTWEMSIDVARGRLGNFGPLLLHDIGRGSGSAIAILAYATGVQWRFGIPRDHDDYVLEAHVDLGGAYWVGRKLVLEERLPETLVASLPGLRVGDVVAGSGHDDLVIQTASAGEGDHPRASITVEPRIVDLARCPASRLAVSTGPFRRLLWWTVAGWLGFVHGRSGRHVGPAELCIQIVATALAMLVGLIILSAFPKLHAAILSSSHPTLGLTALWGSTSVVAWIVTGMGGALAIDAARWNRRAS